MKKSFLKHYLSSSNKMGDTGINESFSNYLFGLQRASIVMEEHKSPYDKAQELIRFAKSDSDIKGDILYTKRNLFKHWEKDSYSPSLAMRSWIKVARNAARKYSNEILGEPRLTGDVFDREVLDLAANEMEQKFREELESNNVNMEELFQ